jgi:murein L,D-transpeptidase YcbB/YkuD
LPTEARSIVLLLLYSTWAARSSGRTGGRETLGAGPLAERGRSLHCCRAAVSSSILPWPIVRRGARAHPVRTLQHLLRARGQNVAVDGIFGPATEATVRAVQSGRGLAVDGVVGHQTWQALIVQVKRGSTGEAVRGVQEEFQFRNLSGDPSRGLRIDGIFGPQTEAAVRGFQQALGIGVDGIVGPITWRALVSGMLSF